MANTRTRSPAVRDYPPPRTVGYGGSMFIEPQLAPSQQEQEILFMAPSGGANPRIAPGFGGHEQTWREWLASKIGGDERDAAARVNQLTGGGVAAAAKPMSPEASLAPVVNPLGMVGDTAQGVTEGDPLAIASVTPYGPIAKGAAIAGPAARKVAIEALERGAPALRALHGDVSGAGKGGPLLTPRMRKVIADAAAQARREDALHSRLAPGRPTQRGVISPLRRENPGITSSSPRELAREAEANTEREHESLFKLLGVHREDLNRISQGGTRKGNYEPPFQFKPNARGSEAASKIITRSNAERLAEALEGAKRYAPRLTEGMVPWYVMDPAFDALVQDVGLDAAIKYYNRFNTATGVHSAASSVEKELKRGTAANMMIERGQYPLWSQFGGVRLEDRAGMRNFPPEIRDVPGHLAHRTAHAVPLENYLRRGDLSDMQSPKVSGYIPASGVPATGFQTRWAVPDAHIAKSSQLPDVRTAQPADRNISMSMPEYQQFAPWYREQVAAPVQLEPTSAQGLQWGLYGKRTGVDTPVGAPKIELLTRKVWERALEKGMDPDRVGKRLLLDVLKGKERVDVPELASGAQYG